MQTKTELKRLEKAIFSRHLEKAHNEWAGADVVILSKAPDVSTGSRDWSDNRHVVTCHALELSWLFERLRDAFYAEERLDGCTKIEFFGRLANAAERALTKAPGLSANMLCALVYFEALAMLQEMDRGGFRYLEVAAGNDIANDAVESVRAPSKKRSS